MDEFHGTATATVRASAEETFDLITDLDRLPEWNRAIQRIVERPADVTPAAEWVVVMRPPGMPSWKSRSHVQEIEPGARFAYRTHTDDSNPSYALWQWDIAPIRAACNSRSAGTATRRRSGASSSARHSVAGCSDGR